MTQISAVILDYGYVFCLAPREEGFEALQKQSGIEPELFRSAYWRHREAYDRGEFDGPDYWQRIARDAGMTFSPEQARNLVLQDRQLWIRPNPVMLRWVEVLRGRGLKTAILSNMSRDFCAHLRRTAKWLNLFTHLCLSGELRLGKPEPAIYHSCLAGLGVPADQTLFIDDIPANIATARSLGMHGLVFQSIPQLHTDLEPFGLAASLDEAMDHSGQTTS